MKRLYKKKTRQEVIDAEKRRIQFFFIRRIVYDRANWADEEIRRFADKMKNIA